MSGVSLKMFMSVFTIVYKYIHTTTKLYQIYNKKNVQKVNILITYIRKISIISNITTRNYHKLIHRKNFIVFIAF